MSSPTTSTWLHRLGTFAPILTLGALVLVFSIQTDSFLTKANLINILAQSAPLGIMAIGITFVLICAQIDLSIAAMATMSGVICSSVYRAMGGAETADPNFLQSFVPVAAAILICGGLGAVNGACTAYLRIPSFMVSLSMSLITAGLALRITEGRVFNDMPPFLYEMGNGKVELFGEGSDAMIVIPKIAIVAFIALALAAIVLRYTRFGRHVYAVGSNPEAAELSGINRRMVTATCLCLCGFTAGASGVALVGRMGSAQAAVYESMLMDCIAAVVVGGTSLFGGRGGIGFTVIGLLTIVSLQNGLNHLEIDSYSKKYISGIILLGALILNITFDRLRSTQ